MKFAKIPSVCNFSQKEIRNIMLIYADGASRNNPGEASAAAYVIPNGDHDDLFTHQIHAVKLGIQTNNVAEYHGLLLALYATAESGLKNVTILMDSNLVVKQFNKEFKCKNPNLRILLQEAHHIALKHKINVCLKWIPREENTLADKASNDILDNSIREFASEMYCKRVCDIIATAPEPLFSLENSQVKTLKRTYQVTRDQLLQLANKAYCAGDDDTEQSVIEWVDTFIKSVK